MTTYENVGTMVTKDTSGNIQKLYEAFLLLQDYVNHYFDSANFQELINNKLDEMVADGTRGERYVADGDI